jgi:hypothetical protein
VGRSLRLLGAILLLALLAGAARARAAPAEVAFVYVEGNVGGASGGHTALRFGEEAFDFEVQGDLLRLRREPWRFMLHRYSNLFNRPVHVARIELAPAQERQAHDHLAAAWLLQQARFDDARERERDAELTRAWLGQGGAFAVPAAGLLDAARPGDPAALALRARIEAERGAGFLAGELARVRGAQRRPELAAAPLRARELLAEGEALRALAEASGLAEDALLAPEGEPLAESERRVLAAYADELAGDVLELLASPRGDRGAPLLLAAARHQGVRRSLAEGRLRLLDAMPDERPTLPARAAALRRAELVAQAARQREELTRARREVLGAAAIEEAGYSRLESLASRAAEYARGAAEGRAVREPWGRLVPSRARAVAVPVPELPERELAASVDAARRAARDAARALREDFPYDILTRNCATELVRLLEQGLGGPVGFAAALGGALRPGEGAGFVPFVLHGQVLARLRIARSERIPSYRERALEELRAREPGALVGLREGNVLSSRIYRWRDRDTRFLLFTPEVFWRRPLYGLANLLFALPDTALGLASAPLDRGRRLRRGAYGMLYSLPELAFVSIRKGTFDAATLPASVRP